MLIGYASGEWNTIDCSTPNKSADILHVHNIPYVHKLHNQVNR